MLNIFCGSKMVTQWEQIGDNMGNLYKNKLSKKLLNSKNSPDLGSKWGRSGDDQFGSTFCV